MAINNLSGIWGSQPSWATHAVIGCAAYGGIYWASSVKTARLVVKYHGGNLKKVVW